MSYFLSKKATSIVKDFFTMTSPKTKYSFPNYLPTSAISFKLEDELHIICAITDIDYERSVVIINPKGEITKKLLSLEIDNVYITENQEYIYIVSSNFKNSKIYTLKKNNLELVSVIPIKAQIQSITATNEHLYAFDASRGVVLELNLNNRSYNITNLRQNPNAWTQAFLTTLNENYFSISLPYSEADFILFKTTLEKHFGKNIMKSNDYISSITYDNINKRLFIAFSNFIAIIEDGLSSSFLYFKNIGITSISYNNDPSISSLTICYSKQIPNKVDGEIMILSENDIKNLKKDIEPFDLLSGPSNLRATLPLITEEQNKKIK